MFTHSSYSYEVREKVVEIRCNKLQGKENLKIVIGDITDVNVRLLALAYESS